MIPCEAFAGSLDAPTNLAVTATSAGSVSLSWNAASGASVTIGVIEREIVLIDSIERE